jgi:peptide deformylase
MSILKIVRYGTPVLREPAKDIHKVSSKIQKLIEDMFDTMYANNGVGLAAPQVGEAKRLFILDVSPEDKAMAPMVFVNPVLIKKEGAMISWEGCLSFPEVYIDVKRYSHITVKAKDEKGRVFVLTPEPESLLCRAIQHEMDHLNGILFIDHVVDRFGTDALLQKNGLPSIDSTRILDEPHLDQVLQCNMAGRSLPHPP